MFRIPPFLVGFVIESWVYRERVVGWVRMRPYFFSEAWGVFCWMGLVLLLGRSYSARSLLGVDARPLGVTC
jgi:hypothetical protein